jgi:hypothetical protein
MQLSTIPSANNKVITTFDIRDANHLNRAGRIDVATGYSLCSFFYRGLHRVFA